MGSTQADDDQLARVDAKSPLGSLLRGMWLPACLSEEVARSDGPPVRAHLLGEDLVAFRDTAGTVGLIEAACPHLGAPLYYGTNRDRGVRCAFHGWKFDVNGRCIEIPMEARGVEFRESLRLQPYPVLEAGGVLWTFLGTESDPPASPDLGWLDNCDFVASMANLGRSLSEAVADSIARALDLGPSGGQVTEEFADGLTVTPVTGGPVRARFVFPNQLFIEGSDGSQWRQGQVFVPFDETETQVITWKPGFGAAASAPPAGSDGAEAPAGVLDAVRGALRRGLDG